MPDGTFDRKTFRLEQQVDPNLFHLLHDLAYTDSGGELHAITAAELNQKGTDLASVPTILWWYVGSYGRHTPAALIHDALVRRPNFDRPKADWIFRDALKAQQVPMLRRGLMWTAVSLETTFLTRFSAPLLKGLLRVVHVAAFVAAVVWVFVDGWQWWEVAVAGALLVSSVVSFKRAGAALLVDHVALLVATLCLWLIGERPSWQAALFGATALTWVIWGRRALWMLFGLATITIPAGVVLVAALFMGVLEFVAADLVNDVRILRSKLPGRPPPEIERPKDVFKPTINLPGR